MRSLLIVASVAMCCVATTGCHTTTSTAGIEVSVPENGAMSVRVDDATFARKFSVEGAETRRGDDGFIVANVFVRNTKGDDAYMQYKFYFYDADGFAVQPALRPWEQAVIHGGELYPISATGPEPRVVKFVLRMRRSF